MSSKLILCVISFGRLQFASDLSPCFEFAGGAELYEAACQLREVLRGRAMLLIEDRTDIVDAAEADGVVISQRGAPLRAACLPHAVLPYT